MRDRDMADEKPQPPDPETEKIVRAALGEWARGVPGAPAAEFERELTVVSARDLTVYGGFLRCLFDVRTGPLDRRIAFRPDAPPKVSDRNDPWSLTVGLKRHFLEQEETVVAAESLEPMECTQCAGERIGPCKTCKGEKTVACADCAKRGRKSCPSCGGEGSIACALCQGSGKVLQSVVSGGSRDEAICPQCTGKKKMECRECDDAPQRDCAKCGNKRVVACPDCGGRGAPLCPQCRGSKMVVAGFAYQVAHKISYYRSLVRDPAVPESVFPEDPPMGKLGETVLELEGEDAAAFEAKKPAGPAGEAFARVLASVPAAGLGPGSRRILNALTVEKIPTYDVTFAFGGVEYRAWVGGLGKRVAPQSDPFADLSGRWAKEAEAALVRGDRARFEELEGKIAAAGRPEAAGLRVKAGDVQRRAMLVPAAKVAGACAFAIPVLLGFVYRSPNRFPPLVALGLAVLGLSMGGALALAAVLARKPLLDPAARDKFAGISAGAGAALALALFAALAPIRRIDAGEFAAKEARYESLPFDQWTDSDAAQLAALIKGYAARGVDVSAGQSRLDDHGVFVTAARARAEAEEAARRAQAEAKARAAEKLEREWREAQAKEAAAKKRAAKNKKKAKKPRK